MNKCSKIIHSYYNSYYTLLLATIPLCKIIQNIELTTLAKEFVDKNGMIYLNNISPSSPQEQHWLNGWKKHAEYLQSISAQKAKLHALSLGLIRGTKDTLLFSGGGWGIGYMIGYVSNLT